MLAFYAVLAVIACKSGGYMPFGRAMRYRGDDLVSIYGSAVFVLLAAGYVMGQQAAPADYKLVTEDVLGSIDLAGEVDSVQDRELRLSRAMIAPGGHIGMHSHQGDPTIVYVLSGVLTNHPDGGVTEQVREGQVFAEFGPRAHWVENQGSAPVMFIVANIHRK